MYESLFDKKVIFLLLYQLDQEEESWIKNLEIFFAHILGAVGVEGHAQAVALLITMYHF